MVLGWFWLDEMREAIPFILALSAASFIYIAAADLVPGLHQRTGARATLMQLVLILQASPPLPCSGSATRRIP